jgi:hypothetical protein
VNEPTEQEIAEREEQLRREVQARSLPALVLQDLKQLLGVISPDELRAEARRQLIRERPAPPRRRGRPPWTREKFWQQYRAARAELGPQATDDQIAQAFGYADTRSLRKRIDQFGLPPE